MVVGSVAWNSLITVCGMASREGSRTIITASDFCAARSSLERRYEDEDDEENDLDDVVIRCGLTFSNALKVMEGRAPVSLAFYSDTLFAIEAPRTDHSMVASFVANLIRDQMPNPQNLRCGTGMSIPLGGRVREPDQSLSPHPRLPQRQYPPTIVEVAASQSLRSLYRSAMDYLQNGDIQMVIGIKMWKRRVVGNNMFRRRLLFLQFERLPNPYMRNGYWVPDVVLSFGNESLTTSMVGALERYGVPRNRIRGFLSGSGNPRCQNRGQAPYVLTIPHGPICFGATFPIPPVILNGFSFDLFEVQEMALEYDR